MKKVTIIIGCVFVNAFVTKAQSPAALQLASHIAKKMKDTLTLTTQQQTQIYNINIDLHNRKTDEREHSSDPAILSFKLQSIEKGRDSLYHLVLPEAKYLLYLQKKRSLVSAN